MTQRALYAVAIGAALCTSAAAGELTDHSTTRMTLHFVGTATPRLEVRDITGSISVEAYDGQDVEMVVDKTITAETEDDMAAARREVKLETADNASTVGALVRYGDESVCGDDQGWSRHDWWPPHYSVRYDFTIRVPRDARLDLCTINRGDVQVTQTEGNFEIRNVDGRITLHDVAGSGNAVTVNGPVLASFVKAPRSDSTFKTINGGVSITMPDGASADVRMKTFNGGLFTDFEVQPLAAQSTVTLRKRGSMSVYRTTGYTTVRIGNGGPELTLESLNGDVRIIRRSKQP
jgi:hypothetical protein